MENDGATPSQLKMRTRSVGPAAACPAVRWMVSMPVLVPMPVPAAATHSSKKDQGSGTKADSNASAIAASVMATAIFMGRWYPSRSAMRPACMALITAAPANKASSRPTAQAL